MDHISTKVKLESGGEKAKMKEHAITIFASMEGRCTLRKATFGMKGYSTTNHED